MAKLLVSTKEELMDHINVYASLQFKEMMPFIKVAQRKYVKEAIGKELFEELLDAYQSSIADNGAVEMSEAMQELWELAAEAIAHLALFEGIGSLNVAITSGGVTRLENQNLKSAYQYQVVDYKQDRKNHGFQALDNLMEYLDENEDDAAFASYKASETRKAFKSQWIQDVKTFEQYRNISGSRWTFLKLKNYISGAARTQVRAVLGKDRFDEIEAELITTLSEANETLMKDHIRPAIAHLAFANAIIDLAMKVDDKGVTIYNNESSRGTIELYKEAPENFMFALKNQELQLANQYLYDLDQAIKVLDGEQDEPQTTEARLLTDVNDPGVAFM